MASVERRERNGKKRWYARYRTMDGKQRTKTFDLKRDAEAFLVEVEASKQRGAFVDPRRSALTVGGWADGWLTAQADLSPTTRERYRVAIEAHIKPRWGEVKLSDVSHAEVQTWVTGLKMAPASARKTHRVLSMVLAYAVKDGRLAVNPAVGISLPRVVESEKRFLSHEEVHKLAEAVGEDYALVVRFLAYTGLRWGEMAALKVSRLDFPRRRIVVAESVTPVRGKMTFGPTKGHERREVPMPRFLIAELKRQVAGRDEADLVFTGSRGAVMRSQTFQRAALKDAAIEMRLATMTDRVDKKGNPIYADVFHPHELRHTAASLAIASGADVKVVQQMLGHKSATMTLDLYGHLFGDRLDVVAEAMEAARVSALADVYPLCTGPELRAVSA
ncbi:MAG: site-specific integrase [Propionibacteriaceae bacterium]|nr:site-specific integrase [Propionibacteriaceae bacterium]